MAGFTAYSSFLWRHIGTSLTAENSL